MSNSERSAIASNAQSATAPRRKPRISFAIATAFGLGYMPKAPGTFGSLAGVALAILAPYALFPIVWRIQQQPSVIDVLMGPVYIIGLEFWLQIAMLIFVAAIGVWTASRVAKYLGTKDPQIVVVDEVSGQYVTLLLGAAWPGRFEAMHIFGISHSSGTAFDLSRVGSLYAFPLNWKCILAGFILFRVFDIWKPFPARQAESLPRGWGIMADDWIAGLYAALGLWILRALGL